eukprot:COSAG02_NODE_49926_length_323_cov_11.379464_1_plen_83_part_10
MPGRPREFLVRGAFDPLHQDVILVLSIFQEFQELQKELANYHPLFSAPETLEKSTKIDKMTVKMTGEMQLSTNSAKSFRRTDR